MILPEDKGMSYGHVEDETAKTGESMTFAVENEAYALIMTAGSTIL